jgi:transposase InsO family protein
VLEVLHSERFVDRAPVQVVTTLLDDWQYLCSPRTMYRLLAARGEVRERRDRLAHPACQRPELVATAPNQVWSWDLTKLRGPVKWQYFHLYVLLDLYSRFVVGWMLARQEPGMLARRLIVETCDRQGIVPGQLTIHADRGSAPASKTDAQLLADLGVERSHSRPHVSNDNPFSESHFATLKGHPAFPDRFVSFEHAHGFCQDFFPWYNTEHRHSGIAWLTPESVLRSLLSLERLGAASAPVRFLFGLRLRLGRIFGWDREPPAASRDSFLRRLSASDRESSLVAPGTPEGPFRVLFVSGRESISEIHNATVHAFSVFVLLERSSGHRLYWAIYVRPLGRMGAWYMRLIDPFRRWIIYPAVLRQIRTAWARGEMPARTRAAEPRRGGRRP